jgi:hypothetical protein
LQQSFVSCRKLALIANRAIPLKTIRFKRVKDYLVSTRLFPWRIDILDTHQPLAITGLRLCVARNGSEQ